MSRTHIVGGGLAGLAAAVRLAGKGVAVTLYEASGQAGGRCRSFHDKALDRLIDNGNHLLLSGNAHALAYLEAIGARDAFVEPAEAAFPFVDLATGTRWTLRPNAGPVPWWTLSRRRRVPDTAAWDYLQAARLLAAGPGTTVAEAVPSRGQLYQRFWLPLTLAVLNTVPERGQARLLATAMRETFLKGEAACRPLVARDGLGPSFVAPALAFLERAGGSIRLHARLRALERTSDRLTALDFGGERAAVADDDIVIIAIPPSQLRTLLPELDVPDDDATILNVHYRLERPLPPRNPPFIGLVNATAHWIFLRKDVVSLTISAADALGLADAPTERLLPDLWRETLAALAIDDLAYSHARVIREKRATFDQSPEGVRRRARPETGIANLFLAGDWTHTGLPATIEGAVRSGHTAAALALQRLYEIHTSSR